MSVLLVDWLGRGGIAQTTEAWALELGVLWGIGRCRDSARAGAGRRSRERRRRRASREPDRRPPRGCRRGCSPHPRSPTVGGRHPELRLACSRTGGDHRGPRDRRAPRAGRARRPPPHLPGRLAGWDGPAAEIRGRRGRAHRTRRSGRSFLRPPRRRGGYAAAGAGRHAATSCDRSDRRHRRRLAAVRPLRSPPAWLQGHSDSRGTGGRAATRLAVHRRRRRRSAIGHRPPHPRPVPRARRARRLVGATDATIVPYRFATQSAVVVLAHLLASPPVASAVGGVPEQIDDGVDGLLVSSNAPIEAWRDALAALSDGDVRKELSVNGTSRRRDHEHFVDTITRIVR